MEFTGGGSFGEIRATHNKVAGVSDYLIDLPATCYGCTFEGNLVAAGNTTTSVFGTLQNSVLSENYPVTVHNVANSTQFDRTAGTLQIASSGDTACNVAAEGTMRYLHGGGGTNGAFQVCEWHSPSRTYAWITH
jgi:hypothetical protein